MFQRFVSASATGTLVIALAALILVSVAGSALPTMWPLTTMWCFVPFAWGIWALLAPRAWLPKHLPYWGAILGFIGGIMSAFVLNVPSRVFAMTLTFAERVVAVAVVTVLYYFLWMLVQVTYRRLTAPQQRMESQSGGGQMKKAA